ncbi:MAG: T9SS type A sorting domain-containing protein [Candidatus Marinimicrobia bacterium]|nr:T9SS type A sorting domain-containing protein [Candidatus Neomarinimicrobiota bacterium]MCF7850608.1 T9SS type A sorting domain-containing protein [Candidatus Neomarinimicrobiota bacterium]MCF7903658.1 T9SS type A sorting domain-containing protein [Candidatus Neomarinimicrobiota bacterium]
MERAANKSFNFLLRFVQTIYNLCIVRSWYMQKYLKGTLMSRHTIYPLVILLLAGTLSAQMWVQNDLIFNPSGIPSLPFSQPRFADLDDDGDLDLILGSISKPPRYFENHGTSTNPRFQPGDNIFSAISELDCEVAVFVDLDGDDDLDAVTGGYTGLQLYDNHGGKSAPAFTKKEGAFTGVSAGINPVPHFADLDGDNDFDLVLGYSESGAVKYYENQGTADSAAFNANGVETWFDVGLYAYPYFSDLDSDGDYDLLVGRDGYGFHYYRNNGNQFSWAWIDSDVHFNGLGQSTYWNSPSLIDLNGDGKQDLVHGTASGPLRYYRNTGSLDQPSWLEVTSLFGGVLDVGGASTPIFIDFDGDGDVDMLSGSTLGSIKYFENIGTRYNAAWKADHTRFSSIDHSIYAAVTAGDLNGDGLIDLVVGDLSGNLFYHPNSGSGFPYDASMFSDINVGGFAAPKLYDMDMDSDLDLIVGHENGEISYYENTGSSALPVWTHDPNMFSGIDVGSNATMTFGYVDNNANLDMITGDLFRELQFFSFEGGIWVEKTDMVSDLTVGQNATPALVDLDGDTDIDLAVGNYDGTFNYFENTTVVGIRETPALPARATLHNAFPNPFNPSTQIGFSVTQTGQISVKIYDLSGRQIKELLSSELAAGEYSLEWDGTDTKGHGMTAGVYLVVLSDGHNYQTQKITYLK